MSTPTPDLPHTPSNESQTLSNYSEGKQFTEISSSWAYLFLLSLGKYKTELFKDMVSFCLLKFL